MKDYIVRTPASGANQLWEVRWTNRAGDREVTTVRGGSADLHRRVAEKCGGTRVTVKEVDG